nr:lytic transglycosylase domain-containing protein [uncultured Halomonas sp.]
MTKRSTYTGRRHTFCRLARFALVAGMLAAPLQSAYADLNDWLCLTENTRGSWEARTTFIAAVSEAAEEFRIAPAVLMAIKLQESGPHLNPAITNSNTNGTIDRGYFQINVSTWLRELRRIGVPLDEHDLHGVRNNALTAAWVLSRELKGRDLIEGVGRYHKGSGDDARARQIRQTYTTGFRTHLQNLVEQCGSQHEVSP